MFKQALTAVALGVVAIGSASAFSTSTTGFESGTAAGWLDLPPATLSVLGSETITVIDETIPAPLITATINPVDGLFMGKLILNDGSADPTPGTPGSSTAFNLDNLGSGGTLWVNFVSADWYAPYDDSATIIFRDASNATVASYSILATDSVGGNPAGSTPIHGWQGYLVPTAAKSVQITVANAGDNGNDALVYIDYSAPSAVPEPGSIALALAGLGVAGALSRRRLGK